MRSPLGVVMLPAAIVAMAKVGASLKMWASTKGIYLGGWPPRGGSAAPKNTLKAAASTGS